MNLCSAWDNRLIPERVGGGQLIQRFRPFFGETMGDRTSQNMILWFFLACFLISISLMGWLLSPFLSILVLGAVVTGVFYPI
jgi:hypothetical protein